MSRIAHVFTAIVAAASLSSAVPVLGQIIQVRPAIAIEVDKEDAAATALAEALRGELRQSKEYQLADGVPASSVIIHIVGLSVPNCRAATAIAVSYVTAATERHLGTAVLVTTPARTVASARDVITKLQQMLAGPERQKPGGPMN